MEIFVQIGSAKWEIICMEKFFWQLGKLSEAFRWLRVSLARLRAKKDGLPR